MNQYKLEIKQWLDHNKATEGVNDFIATCNNAGVEILDITSHVTEIEDYMTYVFIFKLRD